MRRTKADLDQIVRVLETMTGRAYRVEYAYGRPRLYEVIGPSGACRDVSPRLPKSELYDWISAYIDGYSAGLTAGERD